MDRCRVFVIGDYLASEFAETVSWLANRAELERFSDLDVAVKLLGQAALPAAEFVVICQSRPGQFSATQIEQLHRGLPLARLIALVGSHCEGEPRSGQPWPGVPRIYWYDWQPRFAQEFSKPETHRRSRWELPRTAAEVDSSLADLRWGKLTVGQRPDPTERSAAMIGINAASPSVFESLADACRAFGYRTVETRLDLGEVAPQFDLLLWDFERLDSHQMQTVTRFCSTASPRPVIALLGFPRREEREQLLANGVSAVLSKPCLLSDLAWQLEAVLASIGIVRRPIKPNAQVA